MSLSHNSKAIPKKLAVYLSKIPKAALAFSGGVDSAYLLYAMISCGIEVQAYFVKSQFQPEFELSDARRLAAELATGLSVIDVDILASDLLRKNPADRCYHCKQKIFSRIIEVAAGDGYSIVMDGSNASDDPNDRPGMRILTELAVISPLRDCGISKSQVREYSRKADLFTWDKTSYSCLATRVESGAELTSAKLETIEKTENILFAMGFRDFRARLLGNAVKLQFSTEQIPLLVELREELLAKLSPYFSDVLLDLKMR